MNRREALTAIALLMGCTVVGAEAFQAGFTAPPAPGQLFSAADLALLDEVGETILPATPDSPGARAARIGAFMQTMVTDCYDQQSREVFMAGLGQLQQASRQAYGQAFGALAPARKQALLIKLDEEARRHQKNKAPDAPPHYFTLLKQLTLLGYFTSEAGATQALRYLPVPGRFTGCLPYKKGEKAWAT
jgi:Gluconate 2-dehydrogenase subunit 3